MHKIGLREYGITLGILIALYPCNLGIILHVLLADEPSKSCSYYVANYVFLVNAMATTKPISITLVPA